MTAQSAVEQDPLEDISETAAILRPSKYRVVQIPAQDSQTENRTAFRHEMDSRTPEPNKYRDSPQHSAATHHKLIQFCILQQPKKQTSPGPLPAPQTVIIAHQKSPIGSWPERSTCSAPASGFEQGIRYRHHEVLTSFRRTEKTPTSNEFRQLCSQAHGTPVV